MEAKDTIIEILLQEAEACRGRASERRRFITARLEAQAEISFKAGIQEVMAEISRLAIGSGDLNLQAYVVGLLQNLSEKFGKPK